MARQIIALEQRLPADPESGGEIQFRAAFWFTVSAQRQALYADATKDSAVKDGSVSAAELTALRNGSVVEVVDTFRFPAGTLLATIQSALVAEYATRQAAFSAQARLQRYGSSYDGTSWTMQNRT